MFTVFCDETGNSGSRFFSPEQPFYAEGGWYVRNDQRAELEAAVVELEKAHGFSALSKGTRLKDSPSGRRYLAAVLETVNRSASPFFYLVEKRYFICAKAVWTYFDPTYNPLIEPAEIKDPDRRKLRADLLYTAPDSILLAFADAFREQDSESLVAVGKQWADAMGVSGQSGLAMQIRFGLPRLRANLQEEFASYAEMGLPRGWDTLNAPSFAQATQLLEQAGKPCELLHDECATLEKSFRYFFARYCDADRRIVTRADGSVEIFGFRHLRSLAFGNSEALPLLRAADYLLAGCVGFARLVAAGEPVSDDSRSLAAFGISRMMHAAADIAPPRAVSGQVGEIMASDEWIRRASLAFLASRS